MTTLSDDAVRNFGLGDVQEHPVIATDIIFAKAAVGAVAGTGYVRPLVGGDKFVGFAELRADNSAGSAGDINVRVVKRGQVQLNVTGAVITDIGQPIYATDDDTFAFSPVGGSYVGRVARWVSSGVVIVDFDADRDNDPYAAWPVREALTGTKTFDGQDVGKAFFVTAAGDGDALTLPAIAAGVDNMLIVAIDAFGTTQVVISPNASDNIRAADLTAVDDKDLLLTKATQRRGDSALITGGDPAGYAATLGNPALGTPSIWTKE